MYEANVQGVDERMINVHYYYYYYYIESKVRIYIQGGNRDVGYYYYYYSCKDDFLCPFKLQLKHSFCGSRSGSCIEFQFNRCICS